MKLYNIYCKTIGWRFRYLFESIKSLIRWFPTIYKDRDFDYAFILDILYKKIEYVCKHTEKRKSYVNWEDDVRYMKLSINLIDKFRNGYYDVEYLDDKYKNNEKLYLSNNKSTLREVKKHLELYSDRYSKDKNDISLQTHLTSSFKHLKCKKLLFKILTEKLEHWWD